MKTPKQQEIVGVDSHFLDSGAFTLRTRAEVWGKENKCDKWKYYDTDEFWEYMDGYIRFVKKFQIAIDHYANLDAIGNAEITWRNQQYLEKGGLAPVPVVHPGSGMKWLHHYLNKGYPFIAFGGLAGAGNKGNLYSWLDECFNIVCSTPDRKPKVKVHGFAITRYYVMRRYPWYSVDSASWTKAASFGNIYVPHYSRGGFTFDKQPYSIPISDMSAHKKKQNGHLHSMTGSYQKIVQQWLGEIGVPLGKNDEDGNPVEFGVINRHLERKKNNILFFDRMCKSLPDWPWAWKGPARTTHGSFGV